MKRKNGFLLRKVGEINIVVPIGQTVIDLNGIVTLNETGTFLWELLSEEHSVDELVDALSHEFEVEPEQARQDVEGFLEDLRKLGIL